MDSTSAISTITEAKGIYLQLDMNHSGPRVETFSQFSHTDATTKVKFLVNNVWRSITILVCRHETWTQHEPVQISLHAMEA